MVRATDLNNCTPINNIEKSDLANSICDEDCPIKCQSWQSESALHRWMDDPTFTITCINNETDVFSL